MAKVRAVEENKRQLKRLEEQQQATARGDGLQEVNGVLGQGVCDIGVIASLLVCPPK